MKKDDSFQHDFFLAGVMQGSNHDRDLYPQDYRDRLKRIIDRAFPGARIFDPLADHAESVDYTDQVGREVFLRHLETAKRSRILVCYLPVASMGTAIEMWECRSSGTLVLAISPMSTNWIVRFFSHRSFADLESFEKWLSPSNLASLAENLTERSLSG